MLRSEAGRASAAAMPKERMLTETDAPFAQIDGRPLMPWDVVLAYPVLGEIWQCSEDDVSRQVLSNLRRLTTP